MIIFIIINIIINLCYIIYDNYYKFYLCIYGAFYIG